MTNALRNTLVVLVVTAVCLLHGVEGGWFRRLQEHLGVAKKTTTHVEQTYHLGDPTYTIESGEQVLDGTEALECRSISTAPEQVRGLLCDPDHLKIVLTTEKEVIRAVGTNDYELIVASATRDDGNDGSSTPPGGVRVQWAVVASSVEVKSEEHVVTTKTRRVLGVRISRKTSVNVNELRLTPEQVTEIQTALRAKAHEALRTPDSNAVEL